MALNALTKLGPNSLPPKLSVDELNVAGITTSGSAVVTGVTTSGAFHGDLVGSVSGGNISGNATGLTGSPDITVGTVNASVFNGGLIGNVTGDVTGSVTGTSTGLSGTPNITVGTVTGNLSGNVTGDVTGDVTGNLTGVASSATALIDGANILTGNISPARIPTLNQSTSGTSAGLTGVPSIAITNLTGVAATFTGSVSVGGTLTYDDVTNIDSVGLITARSGIKVTSGSITLGSNSDLQIYHNPSTNHSYIDETGSGNLYIRNGSKNSIFARTDGEVILYNNDSNKLETTESGVIVSGVCTATSFVGSGSNLTDLPAGGNSFEAVAEGSIDANKPVYLSRTNGKVKQPSESTSVLSTALVAHTTTHGNNDSRNEGFCSIGGEYFWFGFKHGGSGDDLFGRLGTYNAQADTFFFGSQSNVSGTDGSVEHITPVYDSTADKFMIVYRGGTGHNKSLKYQIGVRSGTSLSYGSAAEFQATEGSNNFEHGGIHGAFDPDNRCITYAWQLFGHQRIYVRTAQISTSSNTASLGSRTEILSGQNEMKGVDICYDTNVDRYLLAYAYKSGANEYKVAFRVGNPGGGTSVSWAAAEYEINYGGSRVVQMPRLAFDPDSNLVLCVMNDSTNDDLVQYVLRITGGSTNTVALADGNSGNAIELNGSSCTGLVYDTLANKMILGFRDTGNSSRPTVMLGTYSENHNGTGNDTYTWGSETQLSTSTVGNGSAVANGDCTRTPLVVLPAGGRAIFYWHPGYPNSQSTAMIKTTDTTHDLTDHDYVGFPDAAYSDGETVTVKTEGSVQGGFSGLTPMGAVYGDTQNNVGTVSSGPALSYQNLGKALGTDKVHIKVSYQ